MGFSNRWGMALSSVLLWGGIATGQNGNAQITVLVNDSAGVEASVLSRAEREAARLFSSAGVGIQWVDCAGAGECRHSLGPSEFVLHIVLTGETRTDSVFGEAFLGEDGRGKYGDVFFDRIQRSQENIDVGRLLGAVSAHELGHLLLGSHAHSRFGIMEPVWEKGSLRRIGMGTLLFTPEQARLMKARIRTEEPSVRFSSFRSLRAGMEY